MVGYVVIFAIGCVKSVRETLGYILPNEELWSSIFPSVDDERDWRQKEHMMRRHVSISLNFSQIS